MPALKGRRKFERSIAKRLQQLFADVLGGEASFGLLGSRFQAILADELTPIYSQAFQGLAASDLTNNPTLADALGRQYASQRATTVANDLIANMGAEAGRGVEPEAILSKGRAEGIGVTEVTTAVTTAENSAREANRTGVPKIVGADVAVDDGMIAIWIDSGLENVCPTCSAVNLKPDSEWRDQFPFGPPAHPNCNCHLEYVPADQDLSQWLKLRR